MNKVLLSALNREFHGFLLFEKLNDIEFDGNSTYLFSKIQPLRGKDYSTCSISVGFTHGY